MAAAKQRLDVALVARGLAPSREKAQALLLAGVVRVNGEPAGKAGSLVADEVEITVAQAERFVSRGGYKLEQALRDFALPVEGRHVIDIGASTGGFTDCLLQHGAAHVTALDVGHSQLDWRIRRDERVTVFEGVNARGLMPSMFPARFDAAVIDVSFISQTKIWPVLPALLVPGAWVVALIKPQFEAGRAEVGRGGIVSDPAVQQRVIETIRHFVEDHVGFEVRGVIESPITGREGNREFLLCAVNTGVSSIPS
jgi:23S rRNA (cytidine1920-2'-O)/16S rRNA (cytidine1409-2'-O)-methyltransferase